jgi:general stress protein YciG
MADKRKRGLAVMAPEKRREIARLGGQMTQRLGKGHTFTLEETRRGGKKGGRTVSRDRAYMAKIGYRGAVSPRRQRAKAKDRNGKES